MSLDPNEPGAFLFEPPAFQLHRWTPTGGFVSQRSMSRIFPGHIRSSTTPNTREAPDGPWAPALAEEGVGYAVVAALSDEALAAWRRGTMIKP